VVQKSVVSLVTVLAMTAGLLRPATARADRHSDAIAGMIFAIIVTGASAAIIGPDIKEHFRQNKLKQEELARAGSSMRTELGERYNEVVEAMANRESAESLAWIQEAGPTSKEAFESYSKLLKAIQR
jgi:hypothetical protein